MRIANHDGRLVIVTGDGCVDVETASGGVFSADPQAVYGRWRGFRTWAAQADMKPPRSLSPGQTLVSRIEGIGELRNNIVAATALT